MKKITATILLITTLTFTAFAGETPSGNRGETPSGNFGETPSGNLCLAADSCNAKDDSSDHIKQDKTILEDVISYLNSLLGSI